MVETLDFSRLTEIFEDDREGIVDVLRACATYVRAAVVDLERLARAGDVEGVARAAHGIKGSCANVGALACERAASMVQSAARDGTIRAEVVREFARLLADLDAEIERYVAGGATSTR